METKPKTKSLFTELGYIALGLIILIAFAAFLLATAFGINAYNVSMNTTSSDLDVLALIAGIICSPIFFISFFYFPVIGYFEKFQFIGIFMVAGIFILGFIPVVGQVIGFYLLYLYGKGVSITWENWKAKRMRQNIEIIDK